MFHFVLLLGVIYTKPRLRHYLVFILFITFNSEFFEVEALSSALRVTNYDITQYLIHQILAIQNYILVNLH